MKRIKKEIVDALNFYNKENKDNLSATAVSKLFQLDKQTLLTYLKEEPLSINNLIQKDNFYYYLDEKEYEAINEYRNTDINFLGIRKKYGYKQEIFQKKLDVLGYSIKRKYKCNYNRNIFKEIKTEEDSYILGFILADGYINEKYNMLRIKLQEKDLNILEKICDYFEMDYSFIKYEYHNITGNKQYYLSVYDKNIINRLKSYGLSQAKSCKEIPYYNIDDSLIRHYIRGMWDGDGYIKKNFSGTGICGSKELLSYIYNVFSKNLCLNLTDYKKEHIIYRDTESNIYRLNFSTKNVYEIINYLYKNSTIYLNRKYELYQQLDDILNCRE